MTSSLRFYIGGIAFFLDSSFAEAAREWRGLGPFAQNGSPPDFSVVLKNGPFQPEKFRYRLLPDISLAIEESKRNPSTLTLTLGCARPIPVGVLLKLGAAVAVPRVGGLFFHGAALRSSDGKQILLIGPSGSGKSTVSEEWLRQGGECGSDEAVMVRPGKDGWLVFPTPFWGRLEPRDPETVAGRLLQRVFLLKGKGLPDAITCVFEADPAGNVASFHTLSKFVKSYKFVSLPRKRVIIDRVNLIREQLVSSG